jgi:hypothetical protein
MQIDSFFGGINQDMKTILILRINKNFLNLLIFNE